MAFRTISIGKQEDRIDSQLKDLITTVCQLQTSNEGQVLKSVAFVLIHVPNGLAKQGFQSRSSLEFTCTVVSFPYQ